jgi:hypothetical protein
MFLARMNSAVGYQPKQVQSALASLAACHCFHEYGMTKQGSVIDHPVDPYTFRDNDPSRPDIQMPDLTVSHLLIGQTNVLAACLY